MKKNHLSPIMLIVFCAICYSSFGQSTFPTNGSNAGIGTTSPTSRLQIVDTTGSNPAGTAAPTASVLKLSRWGTPYYSFPESAEFRIGHGGSSISGSKLDLFLNGGSNTNDIPDQLVMTWLYNGNVGIGTTTPTADLAIFKSQPVLQLFDTHGNPGDGSSYGKLAFGSVYGEWASIEASRISGSADDVSNLVFKTSWATGAGGDGNNIERMRITPIGNVGIGTVNPLGRLHLKMDNAFSLIQRTVNSNYAGHYYTTGPDNAIDYNFFTGLRENSDDFHILNGFLAEDALVINRNSNNVGIGTTSPPVEKLDVEGGNMVVYNTGLGTSIRAGSTATGKTSITMYTSADAGGYGVLESAAASGSAYGNTAINPNGGNVGIGTTTPGAKLDIFGANSNSTNLILSAEYNNTYRWRFNTVDRGNAIDMDITASDNADTQHSILKLSPEFSGRPSLILMNNWLVANNGNIGIGTTDNASWQLATSSYKLAVGGHAIAESMTVKDYGDWPDYVFKPSYILPPLTKVKTYIDKNRHLPEMPSEQEIAEKGLNLGEMNKLLVKKVEELTLYLIEKDKQQKEQQELNKSYQKELISQQDEINELKQQLSAITKALNKN